MRCPTSRRPGIGNAVGTRELRVRDAVRLADPIEVLAAPHLMVDPLASHRELWTATRGCTPPATPQRERPWPAPPPPPPHHHASLPGSSSPCSSHLLPPPVASHQLHESAVAEVLLVQTRLFLTNSHESLQFFFADREDQPAARPELRDQRPREPAASRPSRDGVEGRLFRPARGCHRRPASRTFVYPSALERAIARARPRPPGVRSCRRSPANSASTAVW